SSGAAPGSPGNDKPVTPGSPANGKPVTPGGADKSRLLGFLRSLGEGVDANAPGRERAARERALGVTSRPDASVLAPVPVPAVKLDGGAAAGASSFAHHLDRLVSGIFARTISGAPSRAGLSAGGTDAQAARHHGLKIEGLGADTLLSEFLKLNL